MELRFIESSVRALAIGSLIGLCFVAAFRVEAACSASAICCGKQTFCGEVQCGTTPPPNTTTTCACCYIAGGTYRCCLVTPPTVGCPCSDPI